MTFFSLVICNFAVFKLAPVMVLHICNVHYYGSAYLKLEHFRITLGL